MMEEYKWPLPEGFWKPCTLRQLQEALASHEILASPVLRCDAQRNLHLRPGGCGGIIPQDQVAAPFLSGAQRDIAALSCVGRVTCPRITMPGIPWRRMCSMASSCAIRRERRNSVLPSAAMR